MKILTIILTLFFTYNLTFAQNYNDALLLSQPGLYSDARALGMGNAFSSLSNDFAGVLFNPAGIGLMKRGEFSGGMSLNTYYNTTTFYGTTTSTDQTSVDFKQIGVVYPVPTFRGSLVFAIGYNQVKDFNGIMQFDGYNSGNTSMIQNITGVYNDQIPLTNEIGLAYEIRDPQTNDYIKDTTRINGMLNQSGEIDKDGGIGKWSFASSFEAAKGFYIGGTFNIVTGSYQSNSDYWEDDTKDVYGINLPLDPADQTTRDFQSFYLNDIIDWSLSGWDFQVGILYNYIDKFRFGASIKFPSYINVQENFVVNAESYFGTDYHGYSLYPAINSPIEYEIRTPYEYTLGASGTISMVTVAADMKIMDYTQMEFTEGFSYDYISARQREIDNLMTTTIDYHLGAEVQIPNMPVFGRAGFMYFQSPYDNDPNEFNKKYITAGVGGVVNQQFIIDFAYTYGWWQDYGDNYGVNVSRTYQDIHVDNMILTLAVRF